MIHRNICPICGSENPEESEFCQVCKANLKTLPDDVFPADNDNHENTAAPKPEEISAENEELDLNSPIPSWLVDRFQKKDPQQPRQEMDFDAYSKIIFGDTEPQPATPAPKTVKGSKRKKKEPIYQPQLENLTEPPLMEPDETGQEKSAAEDDPTLNDFKTRRPVKKWDDPQEDNTIEQVRRQTKREFSQASQPLLWWQQDAPLTEEGDPAEAKALEDDPELLNSVSPTKLIDAEDIPELKEDNAPLNETPAAESRTEVSDDHFMPESGSLISDLMSEIGQDDPAPEEEKEPEESGTVFYSGNEVPEEAAPAEVEEIINFEPTDAANASAAALDQILRGFGFQPESEVNAAEQTSAEETKEETNENKPAPEPETEADTAEPVQESAVREKEDDFDDQEIPWDLFSKADMVLPQSPEDPESRTFSRSGIPSEGLNTSYQQRMMSSVLGKIIQAENFVPQQKKPDTRKLSLSARLFWSILAIAGVVVILLTGITDSWQLPQVAVSEESAAFYQAAEEAEGDILLVMDYTPGYSAELDNAAEGLIASLEKDGNHLSLVVMNPAVMTGAQQLLNKHPETLSFAGWWPAGVISLRARLVSGEIPQNVWLMTSDSGSLRSWAEQMAAANYGGKLHVLASGQLEPLLQPYLDAGLVTSAMSRNIDTFNYGWHTNHIERTQLAVWYLAALLPLAVLGGLIAKFLRSDPDYGHKTNSEKREGGGK